MNVVFTFDDTLRERISFSFQTNHFFLALVKLSIMLSGMSMNRRMEASTCIIRHRRYGIPYMRGFHPFFALHWPNHLLQCAQHQPTPCRALLSDWAQCYEPDPSSHLQQIATRSAQGRRQIVGNFRTLIAAFMLQALDGAPGLRHALSNQSRGAGPLDRSSSIAMPAPLKTPFSGASIEAPRAMPQKQIANDL